MFIPDLVRRLEEVIADAEMKIDQETIDGVVRTLHTNAGHVASSRFTDLHVPESTFGGGNVGADLGYHHLKAQEVVSDTLHGLRRDLLAFGEKVQQAEQMVKTADDDSAADLDKKRGVVDQLVQASAFNDTARTNHQSRNVHVPGGGHR
ncbi:MAG: hypothetical protein ACXVWZ_02485 [Nocardioides sp.]